MNGAAGLHGKVSRHAATRLATCAIALALLTACAARPTIRTDYDPAAEFSGYRTYAFEKELGTDKAGYSTLITTHFKRAVGRQLESRGYRLDEQDPDLLVNFYVDVKERSEVQSSPAPSIGVGYYGYRRGLYTTWPLYRNDVRTVHYKTGTANVDLIDVRRKQLIWEGVAEGRLTDEALDNPGRAIDAVVEDLFEKYPARAGSRLPHDE